MTIALENLSVVRGGRAVLRDVSLNIQPRERVALIGPNGSGKTTLLRAMLGILPATSGRVLIDGKPLASLSPAHRAAQLAWLPQQALGQEAITTIEYVATARYRFKESKEQSHAAALQALCAVEAQNWAARLITQLSGGEQQRVALAALLAQEAKIMLADEPANHLDPAQQVVVWTQLGRLAQKSALIVVTHDVNWLAWLGAPAQTRIVALREGVVDFDVFGDDRSLPERLTQLYGVNMHTFAFAEHRVVAPAPLGSVR